MIGAGWRAAGEQNRDKGTFAQCPVGPIDKHILFCLPKTATGRTEH